MNEAVEQFLNIYAQVNTETGNLPPTAVAAIVGLGLTIIIIALNQGSMKTVLLAVGLGASGAVFVLIFFYQVDLFQDTSDLEDASTNLRNTIEQNYNVGIYDQFTKETIAGQDVIKICVVSARDKEKTISTPLGIFTKKPTSHTVYIVKIDNDWQLAKLDIDGNFIPLEAGHVISSLNE